jgi:hypothetical protein
MKTPRVNYYYTQNGFITINTDADLEMVSFSDYMDSPINDLEAELLKLGFVLKSISFEYDGEK